MSSHVPLPADRHSKSKLYVTVSSLESKKREHRRCIETHPFNYRCTVIAPDTIDVKEAIKEHIGCYYKATLTLSQLIDPQFIAAYVKKGSLFALSQDSTIDSGDLFAIDGQGTLIMSLGKDSYEEAGLVGVQAQFPLERGSRHIVKINLTEDCMTPGRKLYERVRRSFDTVLTQKIEFLVGYFDPETGKSLDFDVPGAVACTPSISTRRTAKTFVPQFSDLFAATGKPSDEWVERAQEVFEWIGLASFGSQRLTETQVDPFVSAYHAPEPRELVNLNVASVSGLLSPKAISGISEALIQMAAAADNSYFYLGVWGHEDAPVSWGSSEHGYLVSGENVYAQAYQPKDSRCITFQACGAWDSFS
ncbi:hypothetical protein GQ54DRAFT_296603 [Martensiomyces pterosporus]|nr:hypothetical protein GQ54DRAFT_296603 [Martensiomyces pterosporus]